MAGSGNQGETLRLIPCQECISYAICIAKWGIDCPILDSIYLKTGLRDEMVRQISGAFPNCIRLELPQSTYHLDMGVSVSNRRKEISKRRGVRFISNWPDLKRELYGKK